jgi:serine/threonine-protein kinase
VASPFPIAFGPYELERFIAKGGMAEVFLARRVDNSINGPLCVKRMLPEMMKSPEYVTMFRDEARLSQRLVHPNIVRVFDSGDVDGQLYMAMEYVDGLDVGTLQRKLRQRGEMMGVGHALRIAVEMCKGLAHAHAQTDDRGQPLKLIHRDISPQNVMISSRGEVKVTDFGIAKAAGRETRTQTGLIKGKVPYMSPEQALGHDIDQRLDQFAAGIVAWEMLTGARLYNEKSELLTFEKIIRHPPPRPSSMRQGVSALVDGAVQRALAKSPDARFPDVAAFGNALAEALAQLDTPSQLAPVMEHVMSNREGALNRAIAVGAPPPVQTPGAARKGGLVVAKPEAPSAAEAGLSEAPTLATPSRANPPAQPSPPSSSSSPAPSSSSARPKTNPGTTSPFVHPRESAPPAANTEAGGDTLAVANTLNDAGARPPPAVAQGPAVVEAKSRTSFLAIAGAIVVGLGLGFAAAKALPSMSEAKTGLGGCPLSDPAATATAASSLAAAQDAFAAHNADLAQRLAIDAEKISGSAAGEMLLGKIALARGERAVALDHFKCVFALDPSSPEAAELEHKLR